MDELNTQTVSQFGEVPSFKETLDARKSKEQFYKTQTRLKSFIKTSYKDKFGGGGTPLNVRLGMQDRSEDRTESGDEFLEERKPSPSTLQARLEGSANKYDSYSTIKKEKAKMSQTFTQVTGDKFLPNVIQTPHNQRSNPFAAGANATSYGTPKPSAPGVLCRSLSPDEAEQEHAELMEYIKAQQKIASNAQVPTNGSQIDFDVRSCEQIQARNQRPRPTPQESFEIEKKREILPPPTQSPHHACQTNPTQAQGIGFEHTNMFLNLHKEELSRGVFVSSNKNPILTMNKYTQGPQPLPFEHYQQTGLIPSESFAVKYKVGLDPNMQTFLKSKQPFPATGASTTETTRDRHLIADL